MSSCSYSLVFVCKADRWSTLHSVWYEVYRCHTSAPNLWCKIDIFWSQSQSPNDCWPTKLLMLFLKNETHHSESKYCFVKSHRSWYSSLKIQHAGGTQLLRLTHIHVYTFWLLDISHVACIHEHCQQSNQAIWHVHYFYCSKLIQQNLRYC